MMAVAFVDFAVVVGVDIVVTDDGCAFVDFAVVVGVDIVVNDDDCCLC